MRFALLLLALNLALVLHELGHLVAALILRIRVREVRLGLGPPLFTIQARGVRYSLGSLLVGARVELEGENPFRTKPAPSSDAATAATATASPEVALAASSNDSSKPTEVVAAPTNAPALAPGNAAASGSGEQAWSTPGDAKSQADRTASTHSASPGNAEGSATENARGPRRLTAGKKLTLALAGPLSSALAAVGLLALLHLGGTHVPVRLTVGKVLPGSPAALAGVQPGDRVETLGETAPDSWSELLEIAGERGGQSLPLIVLRGEQRQQLRILMPTTERLSERELGVSQQYSYQRLPLFPAIAAATVHAWLQVGAVMDTAKSLLGSPADDGLAPVLDVRLTAERATPGADTFLRGAALWCVLLALLHLLPIPPLDGGVALLAAIGLWRKRPLSPPFELAIAALGLLLVISIGLLWVRQRVPRRTQPSNLPTAPLEAASRPDAAAVEGETGRSPLPAPAATGSAQGPEAPRPEAPAPAASTPASAPSASPSPP